MWRFEGLVIRVCDEEFLQFAIVLAMSREPSMDVHMYRPPMNAPRQKVPVTVTLLDVNLVDNLAGSRCAVDNRTHP
jgi:hypothetical protein